MSNGRIKTIRAYAYELAEGQRYDALELAILCLQTGLALSQVQGIILDTCREEYDRCEYSRHALWQITDEARQLLASVQNQFAWDIIELL